MKLAMVVSQFNSEITRGLKQGAIHYLGERKISIKETDIFDAPGAFEIPLIAKTLAETQRYDGIICLGCVIKGDTAHFELISLGSTLGLMQGMLQTNIPISFGILTTYTEEQALLRSQDQPENKGREAATACVELVTILNRIKNFSANPLSDTSDAGKGEDEHT